MELPSAKHHQKKELQTHDWQALDGFFMLFL